VLLQGAGRPKGSRAGPRRSKADKVIAELETVTDQFKLAQSESEDAGSEDSDDAGTRSFQQFVKQHDTQIRKSARQCYGSAGGSASEDGASSEADGAPKARSSGAARPPGSSADLPAQSLTTIQIGAFGWIKIDSRREQFNAHCNCLDKEGPNRQDHRTPTMPECRKNRKMKKAPLGFLIAWLRLGSCFSCRKDHKDADMIITYMDRCECRDWLKADPGSQELLRLEADALGVPMQDVIEPLHM